MLDAAQLVAPTVDVIGGILPGKGNRILKTSRIQITSENPQHKIYFTTDGNEPDAFHRRTNGKETTFKYKAPFTLKLGKRVVRAILYSRNGKNRSLITTKTFNVVEADTRLYKIGEGYEDSTSSALTDRTTTSETDEGSETGSARYMERLSHYLGDELATVNDYESKRRGRSLQQEPSYDENGDVTVRSHYEFETPRSIQEMLDGMETPAPTSRDESSRSNKVELDDYLSADWRRLQELEEEHELRQQSQHLDTYHSTGSDSDRTQLSTLFRTSTGRRQIPHDLSASYHLDELHNQRLDRRGSDPRSLVSEPVDRRVYSLGNDIVSRARDRVQDLIKDTVHVTPEHFLSGDLEVDVDPSYRMRVDSELDQQVKLQCRHDNHHLYDDGLSQRLEEVNPGAQCRCGGFHDERHHPTEDHYICDENHYHHRGNGPTEGLQKRQPDSALGHHDSQSFSDDYLVRRPRSRSRERTKPSILKRGRSLERARSRERSRERRGSRSPSRERSRSRGYSRSRSRSPGLLGHSKPHVPRLGLATDDVIDSRSRMLNSTERRLRQELPLGTYDQYQRTRPQQKDLTYRVGNQRDDLVLASFDSDSSLNQTSLPNGHVLPSRREQRNQTIMMDMKMKKNQANQRKSTSRDLTEELSSVSSSLSSSSDESEKSTVVKTKKNGTKNKDERRQTPNSVFPKTEERPRPVIKKIDSRKKEDSLSGSKTLSPQQPGQKTADGALNFFNDSGTQINFWGVSPDEIVQRLHGKEAQAIKDAAAASGSRGPQSGASATATRRQLESSENATDTADDELDQFFITQSRRPIQAMKQKSAYCVNGADDPDDDEEFEPISSVSNTAEVRAGAPMKGTQHEQQGFLGNIVNKVKGIFSQDKDKGRTGGAGPRPELVKVDYQAVKRKCLKSKKLWEDPDFPAQTESLFYSEEPASWPYEWKRPHEICANPKLFVGGASRFDVKQGVLGNCWLLAAVASLAADKDLLHNVLPPDQAFDKDYAGIFRFRFWQYGEWVEVCVDDRLPTKAGQLTYMHSGDVNEFWSPLLEKAYAKLCGCYENLSGGLTSEAMTDFTGGLVECFNFREEIPDNIFSILLKARDRRSLMGCSIDADAASREQQLSNGLIIGHAYSITDVRVVNGKKGDVQLVRVRNPWGNHCEWTGPWSDTSKEWQSIPEKAKKRLGLTTSHDGEFWMSIRDFTTHFQRVEICNHDNMGSWESTFITGSWVRKVNAGGCRNFKDTFWTNPHYHVTITDVDDDDEEDLGTIIVALMQKGRRRLRSMGDSNLTIGYEIFNVDRTNGETLGKKFFRRANPVASSPQYINMREVTGRHRLPPGDYVVMPTTFEPEEEADHLLRMYSEKEASLIEADVQTAHVNSAITAAKASSVKSAPELHLCREAETLFKQFSGQDLEVSAHELKEILNATFAKDFEFGEFNVNLCRSIVATRDKDATGMLGLSEFLELWDELKQCKDIFIKHDKDESGFFTSYELREALAAVGYQVSNKTLNNIVMRYSDSEGRVQFDDFVDCVFRMKSMFDLFSSEEQKGKATFSLDRFIQSTMYS